MAGKTLERTVEEAEHAAGPAIQEQGRRIASLVPVRVPTDAQRLDSSTQAAVGSTIGLGGQAEALQRFLIIRLGSRSDGAERAFALAERGVERPYEIYDTVDDARAVSQRMGERAGAALSASGESLPATHEWDGARRDSDQAIVDGRAAEVIGWMDQAFLGDTLFRRFSETPPVALVETQSWTETVRMGGIFPGTGLYVPGTNVVFVNLPRSEDSSYCLIAHEQLHYAAYLGGGLNIRWRDGDGSPHLRGQGFWNIHEGLTELTAQQLVRLQGYEPASASYPYETAISFAMQQAVGEEPLRRAYLSGDFTEVRTLIDARLGGGTFDTLMSTQVNAEAFSFIVKKASAAGIDVSAWESDPLMGPCMRQIGTERFR